MAIAVQGTCLSSRAAAEAFVGGVCFKLGPPELIGAELEWLTMCSSSTGGRPAPAALAAALGPYAPTAIAPSSPARPLPRGSYVTIEPGGQIELSSLPFASADELSSALTADAEFLNRRLAQHGIICLSAAADTDRNPERILESPRYCAMEALFGSIGPFGTLMMCNTAATQVSIDAGADAVEVAQRWEALHAVGPALLAAFARSPLMSGASPGWASQRMRTWLHLDRSRTVVPASADPIVGYARWALDVPLLCIQGEPGGDWTAPRGATFGDWLDGALDDVVDRRPTDADLAYHLTTLFPPVRAAGHLEIRYLDAQPGDGWKVPVAVFDSLLSDPESVAAATVLAERTSHRWLDAAQHGLNDRELRFTAMRLLDLAADRVRSAEAKQLVLAALQRCRVGAMPTEGNLR